MKKIACLILFAVLFTTCSKDEDDSPNSGLNDYRLKELKSYYDGQLDYKVNLIYEGERLVKWEEIDLDDGEMDYVEFSYDGDLVTMFEYWDDELDGKTTYLIEDGLTKEVKGYDKLEDGTWELTWKELYQYSGSNLVLATYEEYWNDNVWKSKNQFIYEGNNLIQLIRYDWEDNDWKRDYRSVLNYSDNKIIEVIHYQFAEDMDSWEQSWKTEYSYDGNLITVLSEYSWNDVNGEWEFDDVIMTVDYDSNGNISEIDYGDWKNELVYEKGKGNLSNLTMDNDIEYYGLDVLKSGDINNKKTPNFRVLTPNLPRSSYPFIFK